MSEYITKTEVYDLLHGDDELILFARKHGEEQSIGERLCNALTAIPAADVVERSDDLVQIVHAGFVRFTDGSWHCSNCTDELPVDDDDFQPSHADYLAKYIAYCQRCGAKLDKGASARMDPDHIADATKKVDQFREPTQMMEDQVCPKCNSMAHYDPYFGRVMCRQCGWTKEEAT
jgi:ribosomal protein L37AE/L43A